VAFRLHSFRLLGENWPPKSGWRNRLLGKQIPGIDYRAFLDARKPTPPDVLPPQGRSFFDLPRDTEPVSVYCDGGVIGRNPSPHGGTWAWLHVSAIGGELDRDSGIVTPKDVGLPTVTNNMTELLAALFAMEAVPEGWSGTIYTDSHVTELRIERRHSSQKPASMVGIPPLLVERVRKARARLGDFKVVLLGGHPTIDEVRMGRRRDGFPCSAHNVRCDQMCQDRAAQFRNSAFNPVLPTPPQASGAALGAAPPQTVVEFLEQPG
jgi:ribonuclease HI